MLIVRDRQVNENVVAVLHPDARETAAGKIAVRPVLLNEGGLVRRKVLAVVIACVLQLKVEVPAADDGGVRCAGIVQKLVLNHDKAERLGIVVKADLYGGGILKPGDKAVGAGDEIFGLGLRLSGRGCFLRRQLLQQHRNTRSHGASGGQTQRGDDFPFCEHDT